MLLSWLTEKRGKSHPFEGMRMTELATQHHRCLKGEVLTAMEEHLKKQKKGK